MIYVAKREELPEIIEMSLNIPEEHGFDKLPEVNLEKVTGYFVEKFRESPIFVYKKDNRIVGFVGTSIESFWWSDKNVLTDFIFYIHPEHRELKVLNALINSLRDLGKLNDMPVVTHFMSNDRTELKEKLFERHGFKKSGFIATYGV